MNFATTLTTSFSTTPIPGTRAAFTRAPQCSTTTREARRRNHCSGQNILAGAGGLTGRARTAAVEAGLRPFEAAAFAAVGAQQQKREDEAADTERPKHHLAGGITV